MPSAITTRSLALPCSISPVRRWSTTLVPSPEVSEASILNPSIGQVTMRLAVRTPFAGRALLDFLSLRAVPGVEVAGDGWYSRTLSLPHGAGTVRLELGDDPEPGRIALVPATFRLEDLRDTGAAVERVRRGRA